MPDIASLVARVSIVLAVLLALPPGLAAEPMRLESGWELITDPGATWQVASLPTSGWRPARVGVSWNAQYSDLRDYVGVAWYRTRFAVPASKVPQRVLLRFGAVDYQADVFVNGEAAGSHEGAYTPFTLDVTGRVKPGTNELVVRVIDPPAAGHGRDPRFPQFNYDELPRGKQNWYIQNGGLWQPVWLDVRPVLYIDAVRVSSKVSGAIDVDADIVGTELKRGASLKVDVRDAQGAVVASLPVAAVTGPGVVRVAGTVPAPKLWSPASPTLYTVEASLSGPVSDRVTDRFGFREFVARDGRFFLNGEPFYMIGALDQDFYPDTIYSTPGKAYLVDMMKKGRSLGLNVLRCHIKVCDPDYLAAADEVGMLVWYEVPSWERWTAASVERGKAIFEAMTTRDWNRPSIVIQTLINEAWGIDMKQAEQRAGLLKWFDESRPKLQPLGRLLVDNSPCCENFHLKSDIDDYHQVPTRYPTTPTAGTSGWPTSRRGRRGRSARTETPFAPDRSRWSCRSSATGVCRNCRPSYPGGSRATSMAGPSRARQACSTGSTALGSIASSATTRRWRAKPSGASSTASSTKSSQCAGTSRFRATSSRSSPTLTGK